MATFAERAEPHLLGLQERRWRERCDAELGNLRAALAWALQHNNELALRIGGSLWLHWDWNHVDEGRYWLREALDRASHEPVAVRARAFTTYGALSLLAGDVAVGMEYGSQAVDLAVAAGEPAREGLARWMHACRHFFRGDIRDAALAFDQALTLLEQATTTAVRAQMALALSHCAVAAFVAGDMETGFAHCEAALAQARTAESDAMALFLLGDYAGWLVLLGKDTARARAMALEALSLAAENAAWLAASPLVALALIAAQDREMTTAARRIGAMDAAWRASGLEVPQHFQQCLDRATQDAETVLGVDAFAAARTAGHANMHRVIADALTSDTTSEPATPVSSASGVALSARQLEVLALVVDGHSDPQIAEMLYISPRTVSHHVAAIMHMLGAGSRGEAAVCAVRAELL
jgi:DNA-binding NarL/FixJ family response regulator